MRPSEKKAIEAIDQLFSDTSISKEETLASLARVVDHAGGFVQMLEHDLGLQDDELDLGLDLDEDYDDEDDYDDGYADEHNADYDDEFDPEYDDEYDDEFDDEFDDEDTDFREELAG